MTVSTVCAEHNMGEPGQHYKNCTACGHPMRWNWTEPTPAGSNVPGSHLRHTGSHEAGYCVPCRRHLEAEPVAAPTDPDLARLERIQQHSNMQQSWLTGTET